VHRSQNGKETLPSPFTGLPGAGTSVAVYRRKCKSVRKEELCLTVAKGQEASIEIYKLPMSGYIRYVTLVILPMQ